MDIFEIAKREFVMTLPVLALLVIYPQEPFAVLAEIILLDEFFLHLSRGMMVAPRVPLVVDELTLFDKSLGVFICAAVELRGHAGYPLILSRPQTVIAQSARPN